MRYDCISPNDDFIPATALSAALLALTGDTGPGRRKLLELAADARIPLVQQRGRFWGCYRSKLPDLVAALGLSVRSADA